MQPAIETTGLGKGFGGRTAVVDVDLMVPQKAVYGFLGANGAGKTTTIRLLLGLMRADAGRIAILGLPMPDRRAAILRHVGALVETPGHYDHLTGIENLTITRHLLGLDRAEVNRVLAIVGLARVADQRVGGYSLGMRQRLGIARALLGHPRLLVLDEPTNGLDPDGIREVRTLIQSLAREEGCTILLCSHALAEVEQVATHVGLMGRGRLLAQGPIREVLGSGDDTLLVSVDHLDRAARLLSENGLQVRSQDDGDLAVKGDADPASVNALLAAAGVRVSRLARRERSLEDLYVERSRVDAPLETCR